MPSDINETTAPHCSIEEMLRKDAARKEPFCYLARFVLEWGRPYEPARLPNRVKRRYPEAMLWEDVKGRIAAQRARCHPGSHLVMGVALVPGWPFVIRHSWAATSDGAVVDQVLTDDIALAEGIQRWGVQFNVAAFRFSDKWTLLSRAAHYAYHEGFASERVQLLEGLLLEPERSLVAQRFEAA